MSMSVLLINLASALMPSSCFCCSACKMRTQNLKEAKPVLVDFHYNKTWQCAIITWTVEHLSTKWLRLYAHVTHRCCTTQSHQQLLSQRLHKDVSLNLLTIYIVVLHRIIGLYAIRERHLWRYEILIWTSIFL